MAIDAHAVRPELEHASGAGGPLGDSRSVQPWLYRPAIRERGRTRRLRSELPDYDFQIGRGLGSAVTSLQILVEGLPADRELPGDFGLADAGRHAAARADY